MEPMAHQLTSNVKLLQKIVIVNQNQVLLLKRSPNSKTRPNCWDLPGGNMEWPQNKQVLTRQLHISDAKREVFEETGLELNSSFDLAQLVFFDTVFEPDKQLFTILVGWQIKLDSSLKNPEIKISHEHSDYVWADRNQISQYDFGFADFIPQMIHNKLI